MDKGLNPAVITGVGSAIPPRVLTNNDLETMVDTSDEWITGRTGIKERRIADDETATSDLAYSAAREAIADAGIDPQGIDLVIVATVTPDMPFPATACLVANRLGLEGVAAFDLEAGCSGFVYALSVAAQFIAAGSSTTALVIGAETLSKITDWEDRSTCVLFGDGAGAAVVERGTAPGLLAFDLGSDGSGGDLLSMPAGGSRRPANRNTVKDKLHTIQMDGRQVFKFAVRVMGSSAHEAIDQAGLKQSDIDLFIPHQANIRIIEAAAKRLGLEEDRVFINLPKYGNTSSASIPLALAEALEEGLIQAGDHIIMVGFGAGLTWASALVRWNPKSAQRGD